MSNLRLAPIQMTQMVFTKFNIEASENLDKISELWAPSFDFEGVNFAVKVQLAEDASQSENPLNYMVILSVDCPGESEESKIPPYKISLEAHGWFEVSKALPKEKRTSLVHVNGSSMMFGAMREAVSLITGRSAFGPLTLPSFQFLPEKENNN
jgi:preprotein translocase subunit SecB